MKEIIKDKHGFTVTKHKITIRLILKFLLTAAVCIYALYRCSLRACAEDITLSPEQTAALYLRNASATYFARQSDGTFTEYNLAWEILSTPTITGNGSLFISGSYGDNASSAQSYALAWGNSDYVFVRLKWPVNDVAVIPPVQGTNNYIKIDFDLSLSGINGFYGNVLLTCGNYKRPANNTAWAVVGRSEYQYYTSTGTITQNTPVGNNGRPFRILTGLSQTAGLIPEDDKLYMYGSSSSIPIIDSSTPVDLSSLSVIWRSPCAWGYFDHTTYDTIPSFVIAIRTPQIYGYTPPATTPQTTVITTKPDIPAETAVTKPVAGTVDLSNLESGVAALVSQNVDIYNDLEWIGGNAMISANNLYAISMQLERIYQKMWDNGEIPLNAGLKPPNNESLMEFMQSALATQSNFVPQTTYDLRGGLSTYFDIGNSLLSSPVFAPFVLVSAVGLALAVLAFVLFRGY